MKILIYYHEDSFWIFKNPHFFLLFLLNEYDLPSGNLR